jgi:ribonuclease-3
VLVSGEDSFFALRKKPLQEFQKVAGLRFKHPAQLHYALIHRSFSSEGGTAHLNNERLEFLGDSVLGLSVAAWLYENLGDKPEGELARIKSFVVSEDCLSTIARGLRVDEFLVLGKGEELSGGRKKKAILADAMEAIIGALYEDQGFDAARKFVLRLIVPEIQKVLTHQYRLDYKTILQEYVQKVSHDCPRYELVRKSGPDHDRTFWMTVSFGGKVYDEAMGKTKKEAEQNAAKHAYDAIIKAGGAEAERLMAIEKS